MGSGPSDVAEVALIDPLGHRLESHHGFDGSAEGMSARRRTRLSWDKAPTKAPITAEGGKHDDGQRGGSLGGAYGLELAPGADGRAVVRIDVKDGFTGEQSAIRARRR